MMNYTFCWNQAYEKLVVQRKRDRGTVTNFIVPATQTFARGNQEPHYGKQSGVTGLLCPEEKTRVKSVAICCTTQRFDSPFFIEDSPTATISTSLPPSLMSQGEAFFKNIFSLNNSQWLLFTFQS